MEFLGPIFTLNAANERPLSLWCATDPPAEPGGGGKMCSGAWKRGLENPVGVISLCRKIFNFALRWLYTGITWRDITQYYIQYCNDLVESWSDLQLTKNIPYFLCKPIHHNGLIVINWGCLTITFVANNNDKLASWRHLVFHSHGWSMWFLLYVKCILKKIDHVINGPHFISKRFCMLIVAGQLHSIWVDPIEVCNLASLQRACS